jgi:hypothetical protein
VIALLPSLAAILALAYKPDLGAEPPFYVSLPARVNGSKESPRPFYWNLSTLTTTGYGVIVPRGYLARILTNLEAIADQFWIVVTVARLVTLKL